MNDYKEVVVTNTIDLPKKKQSSKITPISIGPLLVEAIERIHHEKAVSPLFESEKNKKEAEVNWHPCQGQYKKRG